MQEVREFAELVARLLAAPRKGRRRLIALAGPPASGKSTLAKDLVHVMGQAGIKAEVVPMDGFHLDNRVLAARDMLSRKGAPETFDAIGFLNLARRLGQAEDVVFPIFDRSHDISIAGAGVVGSSCDTVILEGNYLLFDAPVWRDLRPLWDVGVALQVSADVLQERLVARWLDHGLPQAEAERRTRENDMPNAARVEASMTPFDIVFGEI